MEINWANLPSNVLQQIFKDMSTSHVKFLSLVCKNWHLEADYYLKDKIWLHIDRVDDIEALKRSNRHFQNIRITRVTTASLGHILSILELLKKRKTAYTNKLEKAYLAFEQFNVLLKLLHAIGPLRSLHLINLSDFWKHEDFEDDPGLSFLSSVETLKIYNFYAINFKHILKYFKKLKCLYLNGVIFELDIEGPFTARSSVLKNLLLTNTNINELYLNSYYEYNTDFEPMDFIKMLPGLRKFKTNIEGMITPVLSNNLDLEFLAIPSGDQLFHEHMKVLRKSFQNLEQLHLDGGCFSECLSEGNGLRDIWGLPKLKHLKLQRFNVSNEFYFNSCFRFHNSNLTTLHFENFEVDEDFMAMCSRSTPNIENAKLSLSPFVTFSLFTKMAANWKHLRSLEVDLMLKWFTMGKRPKSAVFPNLKALIFNSNIFILPFNFFQSFKAPNLEDLSASFAIVNCGFEFHSYDLITNLSKNSPGIKNVSFKMVEDNLNLDVVKFACEKFSSLEKLTIDWARNLPLEVVGIIMDTAKNIKNIYINFYNEITKDHEEVEETLQEFCREKQLRIGKS